ncbi:MAG TPA: GGDEF domain-containing protein [Actinomycetota bacterium]|nr:GGDEF domain-containing protein [Actinomycetota bacterium]
MAVREPDANPLLWKVFAGLGAILVAGYFLLPSTDAQDGVFPLIATLGVLGIALGMYLNRPLPTAWILLLIGQVLFVAGDFIETSSAAIDPPSPSSSDLVYLAGYPFMILGVGALVRSRFPRQDWSGWVDAAIVATSIGVVTWILFMAPVARDQGIDLTGKMVALAYPVMDVLLVAFAVRLTAGPGHRNMSFALLLAGLGGLLIGDLLYGVADTGGIYQTGHPADAAFLISYVAMGAAALHPTVISLAAPTTKSSSGLSRIRLTLLAAVSLLTPAVLGLQRLLNQPLEIPVIVGGSTALFLLVVTRMSGLVREVEAKVQELDEQGKILRSTLDGRKVLEVQLRHLAFHDSLTGLANRVLFTDRLQNALARHRRSHELLGVMIMDLDGFKLVNDRFGHAAGDRLLEAVACRIEECLRESDTAARLGGDEFAVLLESVHSESEAVMIAERIIESLRPPIRIGRQQIATAGSIGIVVSAADDVDIEGLLRRADVAMYEAKRQPEDRFALYEAGMHGHLEVEMGELAGKAEVRRS